jgi:sugar (pentulose or hexulose) kinase
MTGQYLIGVDVGTQSAKVAIFNLRGNLVCQGRQDLRGMVIPAPNLAEHPDDDLWDALKGAFQQAMANFTAAGREPKDILAMGICIIRCCRALLKADGRLAYPVINWMDKRLNSPYAYDPQFGAVRYVTTASGYITHRLTAEFKDTCANYIGWWPMDNRSWDWSRDRKAYRACNLPREMLLEVIPPGTILGRVTSRAAQQTGVPAGLPVVATAHDKAVEALGSGILEPGTVLISLGTYIAAMVQGGDEFTEGRNFWAFPAAIPKRYLYECMGVRRGMWTVSWFRDQLGERIRAEAKADGVAAEELLNREAEQIPAGCEGLLTIQDWAAPAEATFRKGVMLGFDGRHTRAHIYRSIVEGIALRMKYHVDQMMSELGTPLRELVLSGGGAHSDLFMQIFADLFGVPARRNQLTAAVAAGCVINAGMAVGAFGSPDEAVARLVRMGDQFPPDPANTALYHRIYSEVYQDVHPYLDPLLQRLSRIVD